VTPESASAIERADEVLYLVTQPLTAQWIERANPRSRSLHGLYESGKPRRETYAEMVDELLAPVRAGLGVCAAFYGHPGVFVNPGHEAIRRARAEGYRARMLPAVSALDCLVADLGIDPAATGPQLRGHGLRRSPAPSRPDRLNVLSPRRENLALVVDRLSRADTK
jgi:uncharacterized protein YabN with tetrapyrrole methylase and pyrophosphatase domain